MFSCFDVNSMLLHVAVFWCFQPEEEELSSHNSTLDSIATLTEVSECSRVNEDTQCNEVTDIRKSVVDLYESIVEDTSDINDNVSHSAICSSNDSRSFVLTASLDLSPGQSLCLSQNFSPSPHRRTQSLDLPNIRSPVLNASPRLSHSPRINRSPNHRASGPRHDLSPILDLSPTSDLNASLNLSDESNRCDSFNNNTFIIDPHKTMSVSRKKKLW